MWKFFQSLFSGSSKSDSDVSLEGWGEGQGFKSETPAKIHLRSSTTTLFFHQGSDHNTANLTERTPDSATIIAQCTAAHDGNVENYVCYHLKIPQRVCPLRPANCESTCSPITRGSNPVPSLCRPSSPPPTLHCLKSLNGEIARSKTKP